MGTRPRVALEVRPEGVVAARSDGGSGGALTSVGRGDLPWGVMSPGLRVGNLSARLPVSGAIRKALDEIAVKGGERSKYVTLVVPDAAVRVLLLDFDELPGKGAEAIAVVRFRLKKLLPFDAEHAVVSYQVMSSGRDGVRVLAVAMPCDVLAEYEGAVTEAGYLPGSVLPSTLAALAGLDGGDEDASPALIVNAGPDAVTTAIVQGGLLLLHRTVDLRSDGNGSAGERSAGGDNQLFPPAADGSSGEWARSERVDYDRMDAETEMQAEVLRRGDTAAVSTEADEAVRVLNEADPASTGREITQAVSVAAAYFEDTLGGGPRVVISAGTMGAERLGATLRMYGMDGIEVREMVDTAAIGAGAGSSLIPRGWLAGVRGALNS